MKIFLFSTVFLATLVCSASHGFSCYIVKTENGTHSFKYYVEYGPRSNGVEGALLKIYGNPDKVIEYASYHDCSQTMSGFSCSSRNWEDTYDIQAVKKDDDYIITASKYGPKTPKFYYLKNETCTLTEK